MTEPTYQSYQTAPIPEAVTSVASGRVEDEFGADLPGAAVETLTLTLILEDGTAEGAIVGPWNNRDVKDANGGILEPDGHFRVVFPPDEFVIPPPGVATSARFAALFKWTWGGGKRGRYRHSFPVVNLERAP